MKRFFAGLALTLGAACAQQLQIYTVNVPASVAAYSGKSGGLYQVWVSGCDPDTAALNVSVSYTANGQNYVQSMITGPTGVQFYCGVAIFYTPSPETAVSSVTVAQLKAASSQQFPQ